jgi:hypothetical protein
MILCIDWERAKDEALKRTKKHNSEAEDNSELLMNTIEPSSLSVHEANIVHNETNEEKDTPKIN